MGVGEMQSCGTLQYLERSATRLLICRVVCAVRTLLEMQSRGLLSGAGALLICCVVYAVRTLLEMRRCGLLSGARCAIDLLRRVLKANVARNAMLWTAIRSEVRYPFVAACAQESRGKANVA